MQQNLGAMDQMFDYASFMWDAMPAVFGQFSPEWPAPVEPTMNNGLWRVSILISGSNHSDGLTFKNSTTVASRMKLVIRLWTHIWVHRQATI
jgi:hypothetical protein